MNINADSLNVSERAVHSDRRENQIIFSLCALLFIPGINNLINSLFSIGMSVNLPFLTPISYIFMAVLSVFFLYRLILKRRSFLILFSFFIIGSTISYLIYPEIRGVIYGSPVDLVYSPVNKLVFFCFPALLGVSCLEDYNKLFEKMVKWGKAVIVLGVLTFCYIYFIVGEVLQYMVYSYFMLLPICIVFESARTKRSLPDSALAVAGTVSIVLCGARGAVLSLFLYFVTRIMVVSFKEINIKKVIKFFVISLAVILVFLFFYHETLNLLIKFLDSIGVDSRFVNALLEDALIDDKGRSAISETVKKGIISNPFGYGLYGDRYVVGTFGGDYVYAHNILFELLCDFGVFFGSAIFICLIWRIGSVFFHLRGREEVKLILALIPYGLFQLLFSSSLLENIPFFVLFGLCFFVNWGQYYKRR